MKKLLIGVICEKVSSEQSIGIIRGIIAQAFSSGCDIVVISTLSHDRHSSNEADIYRLMLSDRFDGFLYLRCSFDSEKRCSDIEHLLLQTDRPVMMADGTEHNIFDSTPSDDSRCFEKLTDHLIDVHGHKVIYCITGPKEDSVSEERMNGYRNSMKRHGLYHDRNYCIYTDKTPSAVAEKAAYLTSGRIAQPEAVVCSDDAIAAVLIEELCRHGIGVPEDIAVCGFDPHISRPAPYCNITSYKRDLFQLGADSLRKLCHMITGNITPRKSSLSEGLVTGVSCGCRPFGNISFKTDRSSRISDKFSEALVSSRTAMAAIDETDLEDALKCYCRDVFYIYRYHRFEVCLSAGYVDAVEDIAPTDIHISADSAMVRYISCLSSGNVSAERTRFRASDIHPDLKRSDRKPMAVFVNLLRNSRCVFGYTALSFGKELMTCPKGYSSFISGLDTVLDTFLKRSCSAFGPDAPNTAYSSLFPQLSALEKNYKGKSVTVVTIEIQNLRQLFLKTESSIFLPILSGFEKILKSCLLAGEKAAFVTNGLYAVITDRISGTEQLFKEIRSHNIGDLFGNEHKVVFSCHSNDNGSISLSEAVKLSLINDSKGYVIDGSITPNPLYEKLCAVRERMRLSPQLDWNIESVSSELGISKSYLQKYYRNNFGASMIDSLIHMRIDMAKKLLRNTDMTVTAIAEKCGYSSYIHFTKQFRKTEGITPTDYRTISRNEI